MSIRNIANQGFSLHRILGSGDHVDSPLDVDDGSKGRLFNFGGRLTERLAQSNPSGASALSNTKEELTQVPFQLKRPFSLTPAKQTSASTPSASTASTASTTSTTAYRVQALERQLHDAKERMQMLNNDRTVRIRKAEEQTRKAMSEERTMRSQIETMRSTHLQEMNQMKRDLASAEAEAKELHAAYTKIDSLEADNLSLTDNAQHLTLEVERLNQEYHDLKLKLETKPQQESVLLKAELGDLKIQQQTTLDENTSLKVNVIEAEKKMIETEQRISSMQIDNDSMKSKMESTNKDWEERCRLMQSAHCEKQVKLQAEIDLLKSTLAAPTPPTAPTAPTPPAALTVEAAPAPSTGSICTIADSKHCFFPPQVIGSLSQLPQVRSTTFSTHLMRLSANMEVESGPDNDAEDKNNKRDEFVKLIVGDFRSYIKPTLKRKGVDV